MGGLAARDGLGRIFGNNDKPRDEMADRYLSQTIIDHYRDAPWLPLRRT
jgi:hypothetical protein